MNEIRRVPHCSHWGAYTLLVRDDEIIGVEPFPHDPSPSPIIGSVKDWATSDRRVLQPLVREGWLARRERSEGVGRGSERMIPVSWDDALDLVAGEIRRISSEYGNESIFAGSYGWTSCGRFHHAATLLKRMLNLSGGFTGHVDTYSIAAGPVILKHVLGDDSACSGKANTLDSISENTETLLVFGSLSPRTAQCEAGGIGRHSLETYLQTMKARGCRVILISPCKEDLPQWMEAEWWPIRPNTDTALMLGLAGEIVGTQRHNTEFLELCCSGSEQFLDYLEGRTDGIRKDAEWASEITDLDQEAIRQLAGSIVSSRTMVTVSWSLQRSQHGEQPFWAALGLAAVIGQIGLPGGGVGYGYASLGGVGAPFGVAESPAMSAGVKAIDSFIPVSRIADMLLFPGREYEYRGIRRSFPRARMVYWAGGNPFHHHQDLNRLQKAWALPETIVVQDPMMTATAQRADILLPASTSIERNDIAGNKRADFVFAMHQAIAPRGEARSDYRIFKCLSERLGTEAGFTEGRDEMGWIEHLYERSRVDAREHHDFILPPFEEFWHRGYARMPVREHYTYLADYRSNPGAHPLRTESRKIVLGSKELARLNYADCTHHPAWIEPSEWLGNSEPDGFHLLSPQPNGRLHSQLEDSATSLADKSGGREKAKINSADAKRLSVCDGQTIRLSNARGACLATAEVVDTVRPGVVVLPTGAWYSPQGEDGVEYAGNPNVLTPDIPTSSYGQGCAANTCLVKLELVG